MSKRKNDVSWECIFDKYDILNQLNEKPEYIISSASINEFREARLMTKFDHRNNLPEIFKQNGLGILPITRGNYLISQIDIHYDIDNNDDLIERSIDIPDSIETIDINKITSEAVALNILVFSGILAEFIGDGSVVQTVTGRMSSGVFDFKIFNNRFQIDLDVKVENAQLEIDGGYETPNFLSLVEAKLSFSDDILVRQIYYPYRSKLKQWNKPIKNIYMTYSNGVFSLYEFIFESPIHYNSAAVIKKCNYKFKSSSIEFQDIVDVFYKVKIIKEPALPFPQADSFKRVINLCEILQIKELSKDEITDNYDFDPRQTNYYTDACRYLGLLEKKSINNEVYFALTEKGRSLFKLLYRKRQLKLAELILEHEVFYNVFRVLLNNNVEISKDLIVSEMKKGNIYKVASETTFNRRASTVLGWVKWIINLSRS